MAARPRALLGPVGDEAGASSAGMGSGHVASGLLLVGAEDIELGVVRAGDDAGDGLAILNAVLRVDFVSAQMPAATETPWPRQAKSVIFVAFSSCVESTSELR